MTSHPLINLFKKELIQTANQMVAPGKGILAADESTPTIKKRFDTINLASTPDNRRAYRDLLLTTPGMEKQISGVILFDETLRQTTLADKPFADELSEKGVIPGIKVDKGVVTIPGTNEEVVTQGLDGLDQRLDEYKSLGAGFAKWRVVIKIGDHLPTRRSIDLNAHALARYAALSQSKGIVPIVEPEILINGDHTLEKSERVSQWVLDTVFNELKKQGVLLEGMILKPSMVTPGDTCPTQVDPELIAASTIKIFKRSVPAAVPGIAFLSGGQTSIDATVNLNEMNKTRNLPWELSFSYGRALQEDCLKAWQGKPENRQAAQGAFALRAKCNGLARFGEYNADMETEG
jgi:fructose-bisphosphate aldolase class I